MIVIEGPDKAGKTTLARTLCNKLKSVCRSGRHPYLRHMTRPSTSMDAYWGYREMVSRNVVQDRFHMSEIVYRAIDGEDTALSPLKYELIDAEIAKVGGVVVLVAPPPSAISDRWELEQRDELYDKEHSLRVASLFYSLGQHVLKLGAGCVLRGDDVYKPKVDIVLDSYEWPDETCAELIASIWQQRQDVIDLVASRRPQVL